VKALSGLGFFISAKGLHEEGIEQTQNMVKQEVTEQQVKAANRDFYEAVAERYEEIDGRRSSTLEAWLCKNLAAIRHRAPGGSLLDIGTGSGFVTRCAAGLFPFRIGIDLSSRILAANRTAFDFGVTGDTDNLPFSDNSFDVVTCFAVLHHLYAFEKLVSEVARVLKPGGVFYSDHDMDAAFSRRFRLPLVVYRRLHNAKSKYQRASNKITRELYELAEYQEDGVDSAGMIRLLERMGFLVEAKFHWYGLTRIADRLFSDKAYAHGWAPMFSTLAFAERGRR
jgi:ubiquinone/menaquinone biosynthesis C-methylase UbiE